MGSYKKKHNDKLARKVLSSRKQNKGCTFLLHKYPIESLWYLAVEKELFKRAKMPSTIYFSPCLPHRTPNDFSFLTI